MAQDFEGRMDVSMPFSRKVVGRIGEVESIADVVAGFAAAIQPLTRNSSALEGRTTGDEGA
jgi:hypothetical protein